MSDQVVHLRSYRVVFDLDRRIHRVDRFRVPLPYGLPLRSVAYAVFGLALVLVAGRLPLVGVLLAGLPAPARYVLVPIGLSYAMTQVRVDGRSAHTAAVAWLRFVCSTRALCAFRRLETEGVVHFDALTLAHGEMRTQPRPRRAARSASRERSSASAAAGGEQLGLW